MNFACIQINIETMSSKSQEWTAEEDERLLNHLVEARRNYGDQLNPFWPSIANSFSRHRNGMEVSDRYNKHLKDKVEKRLAEQGSVNQEVEDSKAKYSTTVDLSELSIDKSGSESSIAAASQVKGLRELYMFDVTREVFGDKTIVLLTSARDTELGWFKPPMTVMDDLPRGEGQVGIYELSLQAPQGDDHPVVVYVGATNDLRKTLSSIRRSGDVLHPLLKPFLDLGSYLHARVKLVEGDNALNEAHTMKKNLLKHFDYAFNLKPSALSLPNESPRRWPFYRCHLPYLRHRLVHAAEGLHYEALSSLSKNDLDILLAVFDHQRLADDRTLDINEE